MPCEEKNCSRIILGTAQWGLDYGISNTRGVTSVDEVSRILKRASLAGIKFLDTAPGYGNSEKKIGQFVKPHFKVITKIPSLMGYRSIDDKVRAIKCSIEKSISNLGASSVFGLLFHDANDLVGRERIKLLEKLNKLKASGVVENIGVSIYNGEQIDTVLDAFVPDIVQVPLNVLDQRLLRSGHLEKLKSLGVKIHARSVFLQGLFHMPINDLPPFFRPIRSILLELNNEAFEQRVSMDQAALSFVRDQPYVDNVLIGIESLSQLNTAINNFSMNSTFNPKIFKMIDEKFLNPAKWSLSSG